MLVPGSAPHRPEKRWPASRYQDLAEALRGQGLMPVVVGSMAEAAIARDVPAAVAERVLDRFTEVGLIDDAAFAATWVRSRHATRGLSRSALRRVDTVLADNADPLKSTIANLQVFSEALARNSGKLDGIVAGLEKLTGGGAPAQKITYDLRAVSGFAVPGKTIKGQLALPEPTAVAMLETQRMLFSPAAEVPGFADFLWADAIPKLLQARLIESFENYDIAHAPLRTRSSTPTDTPPLVTRTSAASPRSIAVRVASGSSFTGASRLSSLRTVRSSMTPFALGASST